MGGLGVAGVFGMGSKQMGSKLRRTKGGDTKGTGTNGTIGRSHYKKPFVCSGPESLARVT